jgi:HK97 gp10 family phage protein
MSIDFNISTNEQDFDAKLEALDLAMQDYVQQALNQTAQDIMVRAKQLAPVRSGRLMQGIYAQVVGKWIVRVSCTVPYAIFQELGTRFIAPHLFLTQALQENCPKLFSILTLAMQNAVMEASGK